MHAFFQGTVKSLVADIFGVYDLNTSARGTVEAN